MGSCGSSTKRPWCLLVLCDLEGILFVIVIATAVMNVIGIDPLLPEMLIVCVCMCVYVVVFVCVSMCVCVPVSCSSLPPCLPLVLHLPLCTLQKMYVYVLYLSISLSLALSLSLFLCMCPRYSEVLGERLTTSPASAVCKNAGPQL
jgi:hypothetical protein